jgi:hypothetical protein
MIAVARFDADLVGIVGHPFDMLVAIERHQYRMTDRHRVGAECERLGDVAAIADAAGIDKRYVAALAELIDGAARLADGGDAGNAGILGRNMRAGAGAALHGIDID